MFNDEFMPESDDEFDETDEFDPEAIRAGEAILIVEIATDGDGIIDQRTANELLELTEEDAEAEAAERGWIYRVGSLDGMHFPLTRDYRPNRVTVIIEEDEVVAVEVG